ncbi:MAG: DUF1501 domain-containing protein [Pirellulales bacterium]|nr:DUF1501 domain-containing protein [Pirellulales bacterium]
MQPPGSERPSRREWLLRAAGGFGGLALAGLLSSCQRSGGESASRAPADTPRAPGQRLPQVVSTGPRKPARHVICLYMDGGPSQIDTFDRKPRLDRENGQPIKMSTPQTQFRIGNKVLASPFKFSQYGENGTWVSELFRETAQHIDRLALVRSMVADHSEHTAANYQMHTGWPLQGRPSMGSWITYGLGTECQDLPGYVVLDAGQLPLGGLECFSQGFLPLSTQGTLFRRGDYPVADIRPQEPRPDLQRRKLDLMTQWNRHHQSGGANYPELEGLIAQYEMAFQMQSAVPALVNISDETPAMLRNYGIDQPHSEVFGRQCLLARRLVERGVRFVQVLPPPLPDHNHWDQHNKLAAYHRDNALAVDRPIAGLITDLVARGLWDETLLVWGGEFGRTPTAQEMPDGQHGRDHNPYGFTMWLAGGAVRGGTIYGATDEYGYYAVENPVHVHDLHATILQLMGIDHTQLTYRYGGRDFRLTDVYGNVVHDLIA